MCQIMGGDPRLSRRAKKNLSADMAQLATSGIARGRLYDIYVARTINDAVGGAVVAPWDIDDLPEDWLDAASALARGLSETRDAVRKIESAKARYLSDITRR